MLSQMHFKAPEDAPVRRLTCDRPGVHQDTLDPNYTPVYTNLKSISMTSGFQAKGGMEGLIADAASLLATLGWGPL
jgi:hypothetical protein